MNCVFALSATNPKTGVPLEKETAFPSNKEGKGSFFFRLLGEMNERFSDRCSLKIELCNSRNPQALFLLEDRV